jgi:hypothetical protein
MKRTLALFLLLVIGTVLVVGCTGGNADDQFRSAWQSSENDVKAYGEDMRSAMDPDNINIKVISDGSRAMISTIDRHHDTISSIQVSEKYQGAKTEYLSALSDLRMACVDLSKAEDAGSLGALGHITASAGWLESSQQKRDRVTAIMT